MRTLELFAGTQSFSKAVMRNSPEHEVITLDILPKFSPTITADILEWDYTTFPSGYFDVIWCSPPCTDYSKAKTWGKRNLELADRLVRRCFEIIDFFAPRVWIIENVGTGLLVKRMESIRSGLASSFVDYCPYGKPYRKRTILWSNISLPLLKKCPGKGKCNQMNEGKHIGSCGNGSKMYNSIGISSVWDKDAIPDTLCDYIVEEIIKPP